MTEVGEAALVIRFGRSVPAASTEREEEAVDETADSQARGGAAV
jgi:hypothetical protein